MSARAWQQLVFSMSCVIVLAVAAAVEHSELAQGVLADQWVAGVARSSAVAHAAAAGAR